MAAALFPEPVTGNGQPILNGGQGIIQNQSQGNLTNVNNLIQGAGQFGNNGLIVVNQAMGVIKADGAFGLALNTTPFTNEGLVIADGSPTPGAVTANNYTQTASGGFEMVIGGTTVGSQYSQLQNSGTVTLAGALDISS